jgi:hypothetical protein
MEQIHALLVVTADATQGVVIGAIGEFVAGLRIGFDSGDFPRSIAWQASMVALFRGLVRVIRVELRFFYFVIFLHSSAHF